MTYYFKIECAYTHFVGQKKIFYLKQNGKNYSKLLDIRKRGIYGEIKFLKNTLLTYEPITETGLIISGEKEFPVNISMIYQDELGIFTVPQCWTSVSNKNIKLSTVNNQIELAYYSEMLKKSIPDATSITMSKIQSLSGQREFSWGIQKCSNPTAKFLFMEKTHMTEHEKPQSGQWGMGFRFSDAEYVSHFTKKKDEFKELFIVEVLIGYCFCYGKTTNPNLFHPPMNRLTNCHYDSVSGILGNHEIYTVYKSENFIKRYVIRYK